jgi:hypothetical protein
MSLDFFQRSSGLTKLLGSPRLFRRGSTGTVGQALTIVFRRSCGELPGESIHLHCFHPWLHASERYRPSWGGSPLVAQVPNWESLKVIALDKFDVNSNLSSGNAVQQTAIDQHLGC